MTRHRSDVVELSTRLIEEFEDVLPPGQVISAVVRSHRLVLGTTGGSSNDLQACEDIARRLLASRARPGRRVRRTLAAVG